MLRRSILALILALFAFVMPANTATAQSVTMYPLEVDGFENVVETGDVLIVMLYNLPLADWQSSSYLLDATCTDTTDVIDPCYTSLLSGAATQTFKDSAGVVIGSRSLPRIWYGLSGNYFCAPDSTQCAVPPPPSLSFGDTSAQACILGPSSISPQPESCASVTWHATSSIAETAALLPNWIVPMIQDIQTGAAFPSRSFINGQLITETGAVFAQEAFPWLPRVAPAMFTVGVGGISSSFNPPTPNPTTGIPAAVTDAQSGAVFQALEGIGTIVGAKGIVVGVFFSFLAMIAAFIYFISIVRIPDSGLLGASGSYLVLLTCLRLGWFPGAAVFSISALIVAVGAFSVIREILTD